jgi:NTP pyrophosphatase (non-canonical NTP hydrolase)
MDFQEYHKVVNKLAQYPNIGDNLIYPALGLAGEAGEVVDKIKKLWRNQGITMGSALMPLQRADLIRELGDVLWYLDALATEIHVSLEEVAALNCDKLLDRNARGVVKSEGDNR